MMRNPQGRSQTKILLALAVFGLWAGGVGAQSLDYGSIDGGGGNSSAVGSFTVIGTIGQMDAGFHLDMSTSAFQLEGGFWHSQSSAVPVELLNFEIVWNADTWFPWTVEKLQCRVSSPFEFAGMRGQGIALVRPG